MLLFKVLITQKKTNNKDLTIRTLSILASIKAEFGQESEAILLQKGTLRFLEENRDELIEYDDLKLDILSRTARCYAYNMEIDSAHAYANQALEISKVLNRVSIVSGLKVLKAQLEYYTGDIVKAKEVLEYYVKDEKGM